MNFPTELLAAKKRLRRERGIEGPGDGLDRPLLLRVDAAYLAWLRVDGDPVSGATDDLPGYALGMIAGEIVCDGLDLLGCPRKIVWIELPSR